MLFVIEPPSRHETLSLRNIRLKACLTEFAIQRVAVNFQFVMTVLAA